MTDNGKHYIHVSGVVVKITPLGLHRFAKEYISVVKIPEQDTPFSPVPYFLVCRSIELSIKSFLRVKDIPMSDLKNKKKYRHDLVKLLNKAKELEIVKYVPITENIDKEISKANEYYDKKEFEYYEVLRGFKGYPDLPDLIVLKDFADELVIRLEAVCVEA